MRLFLPFAVAITIFLGVSAFSDASAPNGGWEAAWSPDGKMLAFVSGSPHSIPNLWVAKADGSALRQLTTGGAHEPQWMPDGKTIVLGTIRSGTPTYMAVDMDGKLGGEKPVEAIPAGAEDPLWSRDGSLVIFGMTEKDATARNLWFSRAGGGGASGLTDKFWCREWTWSPDGNTIAFVVGKATGTSLWTLDLSTKDMRLLYKGFCSAPAYSPDGKRLAIAVPDVRSGFKITIIDLTTGKDKRIGVRTFNGKKIIWSPDGTRLYFASSRKSEPSIWSIGADAKDLRRLTPEGTKAQSPSLSPDGKKLAFQASMTGSYSSELCVCDASAGDNLAKFTRSHDSYWAPLWSPDGGKLAFQTDVKHVNELRVRASGREKTLSALNNPEPVDVAWFPDSKRLLVGDAGSLLTMNSAGGKDAVKAIPKLANPGQSPQLANDMVYYTEWLGQDACLSAVKLDGAGKKQITQRPVEKPESDPKPEASSKAKADAGPGKARMKLASYEMSDESPFVLAQAPADSSGNPHADLGIIAPQADISPAEKRITVVDLTPAVSPDQKSIAFARNGQLWLVGIDGTNERQLTQFKAVASGAKRVVSSPCWNRQGNMLLFPVFSDETGRLALELWLCGLEPGTERRVYSENVETEFGTYYADCTYPPAFTPDQARILFTSLSTGQPRIISMGLDGTDLRELVDGPASFPTIDLAGKKLAYVDLSNSLERLRILDLKSGKRAGTLVR